MENTVRILSTNLCAARKEKILKTLEERLSKGEKTKIFTPNTQMLLAAEKDTSLANLLGISDLNLPDGTGLIMASKMLGTPLPERMAGIDVAEDILKIADRRGYSVFLLGGKKGRARKAARTLERAAEQVEQEKKRAVNEIKNEVSEMAISIASAVIERDVSKDEHTALIDSFIDKMGD